MAIKKIGVDLDGVVADFYKGFTTLARNKFGDHIELVCGIKDKEKFSTWKLEKIMNLTKEEVKEMMNYINNNPSFYESLGLLEANTWEQFKKLYCNRQDYEITFITSRKSSQNVSVREISKWWLAKHGWENPSVIVTDEKGITCKLLGIEKFVDDSLKNCLDIHGHCQDSCEVFILDYPHNRDHNIPEGIKRIHSFEEFITKL